MTRGPAASQPVSEILDGFLFLSDMHAARSLETLRYHGITHVVNATAGAVRNRWANDDIEYLSPNIEDDEDADIHAVFADVFAFVHAARLPPQHTGDPADADAADCAAGNGGVAPSLACGGGGADEQMASPPRRRPRVLVHCMCGVSRSATLVVAYLMRAESMTLQTAFAHVKARRSMIAPNPHFARSLMALELELASQANPQGMPCTQGTLAEADMVAKNYRRPNKEAGNARSALDGLAGGDDDAGVFEACTVL